MVGRGDTATTDSRDTHDTAHTALTYTSMATPSADGAKQQPAPDDALWPVLQVLREPRVLAALLLLAKQDAPPREPAAQQARPRSRGNTPNSSTAGAAALVPLPAHQQRMRGLKRL